MWIERGEKISPNIIGAIKPRSVRWTGDVARTGELTNAYKFWLKNLKGRDHSKDLLGGGKIILEWILGKQEGGGEGADWIHVTQDKNQWRDLMKTVMNLRVTQKAGNFLIS
jgi:hypothetical protein